LEQKLTALINSHALPWNITRLGARLELQFCASTPTTAQQAREAQNDVLEGTIHLYLLNRGVLLTPFHNMMLICPATTQNDVDTLVSAFGDCLTQLNH
jgi:glutamate-1-semialdehyde 2,1-aminomutase